MRELKWRNGIFHGVVRRGGRQGSQGVREREGGGEGEEGISRREIKEALRGMKDGKAMGTDEIPGELWKYGGEEVEEWVFL